MERFGFKGISLDNLEDVFNPILTGIASMSATRTHLITRGMTEELADKLALRYIQKVESAPDVKIFSLMDLFNSSANHEAASALTALIQLPSLAHLGLNLSYQTWDEYRQAVSDSRVRSAVRFATHGQH
jgi:hypothetical protein